MAGVDPLGQSLYFQATAAAQQQIAAKKKNETEKTKKTSFKAIFQKVQEETELEADGLPIELAGMDMESAVIFLKDNVDIAGEVLESTKKPSGNFCAILKKIILKW